MMKEEERPSSCGCFPHIDGTACKAIGVECLEDGDAGVEGAVPGTRPDGPAVPAAVGELVPQQPGHRRVQTQVRVMKIGGQRHEHACDAGFRRIGSESKSSVGVGGAFPQASAAVNGSRVPFRKAQPAKEEEGVCRGRPLGQVESVGPGASFILCSQQLGAPPFRCHALALGGHRVRGRAHEILKDLPSHGRIALKQPLGNILCRGTGRRRLCRDLRCWGLSHGSYQDRGC